MLKNLSLTFLVCMIFTACGGSGVDYNQLKPHTVQESSLGVKGKRIQINVTQDFLPRSDCENLINYYKSSAQPNGQVSIHGPSRRMQRLFPNDPASKLPQSWAYDNLDGTGIHYNDHIYGE